MELATQTRWNWRFRWRTLWHRRKFAAVGRGTCFSGRRLESKGVVRFGQHCWVGEGVVLRAQRGGGLHFGDGAVLGDHVIIQCDTPLHVGAGAYIGAFTVLRDTHHMLWGTDLHWRLAPHYSEPIVVEAGAYVGAQCYIGPGIQIGEGALIGPGSIVAKPVGAYEIWAGRPATFLGRRDTQQLETQRRRQLDLVAMFGVQPDAAAASHAPPPS